MSTKYSKILFRPGKRLQSREIEELQECLLSYGTTGSRPWTKTRGLDLFIVDSTLYISKGSILIRHQSSTYNISIPSTRLSLRGPNHTVGVRIVPRIVVDQPDLRDPMLGGTIVGCMGMSRLLLIPSIELDNKNALPIGLIRNGRVAKSPGIPDPLVIEESGDFIGKGLEGFIVGPRLYIYPGSGYVNGYYIELDRVHTIELPSSDSNIYLSSSGEVIIKEQGLPYMEISNPIVVTNSNLPVTNSSLNPLLTQSMETLPVSSLVGDSLLPLMEYKNGRINYFSNRRLTKLRIGYIEEQLEKLERDSATIALQYQSIRNSLMEYSGVGYGDNLLTLEGSNIYHSSYSASLYTGRGIGSFIQKDLLLVSGSTTLRSTPGPLVLEEGTLRETLTKSIREISASISPVRLIPNSGRDLIIKYSNLPVLDNYELYINNYFINSFISAPYSLTRGLSPALDGSLELVLDIPFKTQPGTLSIELRRAGTLVKLSTIEVEEFQPNTTRPSPALSSEVGLFARAQCFSLSERTLLGAISLLIEDAPVFNTRTDIVLLSIYSASSNSPLIRLGETILDSANLIRGTWSRASMNPLELVPGTYYLVIEPLVSGVSVRSLNKRSLTRGLAWNSASTTIAYRLESVLIEPQVIELVTEASEYSNIEHLITGRNITSINKSSNGITLSVQGAPLSYVDLYSSYFLGTKISKESTWISKQVSNIEAYNRVFIDLEAELEGSSYLRVYISSDGSKSWDELDLVSSERFLTYRADLSPTIEKEGPAYRTSLMVRIDMYTTLSPVIISNLRLTTIWS